MSSSRPRSSAAAPSKVVAEHGGRVSGGGPHHVVAAQPRVEVGRAPVPGGRTGRPRRSPGRCGARTKSGRGALQRAVRRARPPTLAVSTRWAPLVSSRSGVAVALARRRHREEQAVGDRADLAAERVGGELGGVHRVGQHDDPAGAATGLELGPEAGDGRGARRPGRSWSGAGLAHGRTRGRGTTCRSALDGLSGGRCTFEAVRTRVRSPPRWRVTSTPILHRGTEQLEGGAAVRRYDDPVEVRKGADEDPDQFLWRGRLWQVREVVAHWVETGAWWTRRAAAGVGRGPAGAPDADLLREREVWRVAAARGGSPRSARPPRSRTPASASSTWCSAGPRAAGSSPGRWTEVARLTDEHRTRRHPALPAPAFLPGGDPLLPRAGRRVAARGDHLHEPARALRPRPRLGAAGDRGAAGRPGPAGAAVAAGAARRTPGCCSPRWRPSWPSGRASSPRVRPSGPPPSPARDGR